MFCIQCGSPMQDMCVACPRCGQRYEKVSSVIQTARKLNYKEGFRRIKIFLICLWVVLGILIAANSNAPGPIFAFLGMSLALYVTYRIVRFIAGGFVKKDGPH